MGNIKFSHSIKSVAKLGRNHPLIRTGGEMISLLASIGFLILDISGVCPVKYWRSWAIFAIALFGVLAFLHILDKNTRIDELETSQPNLAITDLNIQEITITLERKKMERDAIMLNLVVPNYEYEEPSSDSLERRERADVEDKYEYSYGDTVELMYVEIDNQPPKEEVPCVNAEKVVVKVTFFNNDCNTIINTFNAKWEHTQAPTTMNYKEQPRESEIVDIECGHPRKLYFMVRKKDTKTLYALNNESYKDKGWRLDELKIKTNDFKVKFKIFANQAIPKQYWYQITNNGRNKKPSISPTNPCPEEVKDES